MVVVNKYFSTFISGFQEIVDKELRKKLPECEIVTLSDGLVIYETSASIKEIQKIRFLNNSFILLSYSKRPTSQSPEAIVSVLLRNADFGGAAEVSRLGFVKYFRVMVSKENQTVSISQILLDQVERTITQRFRLKVHRTLPDIEFWFFIRSDGLSLFGARITPLGKTKVRKYEKGELRQELVNFLILLSDPQKEDVVLDPFTGSGAIILERVQGTPYKKIYAGDIDRQKVDDLIRKTKWGQAKIVVEKLDALNLNSVEDGLITKIITDPPWGVYEKPQENMIDFYKKMLLEFYRVLAREGSVVILIGRESGFGKALLDTEFKVTTKLDILVSGQKTNVYKISK